MMFEKLSKNLTEKLNQKIQTLDEDQDLDLIPISSMEEVAVRFRNTDENTRYEYYLLEVKTDLNFSPQVSPPPFRKTVTTVAESLDGFDAEENFQNAPVVAKSAPAAATVAPAEKEDIPFLAENADLLLNVGELELARNIYRAILKSGDASDVAYAGLAACADKEGLVEQAIQFAWDSVAFAPNQRGYQLLAQLLVQQGRDQEASQALNRALRSLDLTIQQKADYYKMIGNCQSRLGQSNDAERSYKKALELSPKPVMKCNRIWVPCISSKAKSTKLSAVIKMPLLQIQPTIKLGWV